MPRRVDDEQSHLTIDDPEGWRLRVVWSRSGKRAGLSMEKTPGMKDYRQMELTPQQVEELIDFFAETLPSRRESRQSSN